MSSNNQGNPSAAIPVYSTTGGSPMGYQQITSLGAAQHLTVPTGAQLAIIVSEAQAVRYRDDGTAPTAAIGMPLAVGQVLQYTGDLSEIEFIEQAGGAKLNISYY